MAQSSGAARIGHGRWDLRWPLSAAVLGLTLGGPTLGFALWCVVFG